MKEVCAAAQCYLVAHQLQSRRALGELQGREMKFEGHAGYIIGLLERGTQRWPLALGPRQLLRRYGVTDIWWLRIWAVCGCSMVVLFQVLQPRCQWLSAGWCFVYVVVNLFQLHWVSLNVPVRASFLPFLRSAKEPRLSQEEELGPRKASLAISRTEAALRTAQGERLRARVACLMS